MAAMAESAPYRADDFTSDAGWDDDDEAECASDGSFCDTMGAEDAFELILDEALRPVDKIIMLQSAKGAWVPSAGLSSVLGVDVAAGAPADTAADAWATAIVVAYLRARMADDADEWQLLADKALRWLRSTGADVDALLAAADAVVGA